MMLMSTYSIACLHNSCVRINTTKNRSGVVDGHRHQLWFDSE